MPYNGGASSGSNQGPRNPALADAVTRPHQGAARRRSRQHGGRARRSRHRVGERPRPAHQRRRRRVPAGARRQGARAARRTRCRRSSTQNTEGRTFGLLGEPRVNVRRAQSRARPRGEVARDVGRPVAACAHAASVSRRAAATGVRLGIRTRMTNTRLPMSDNRPDPDQLLAASEGAGGGRAAAAGCASTSARRPASARRTRC